MPPPRSNTTCYQCRARKVRCAGRPGPCKACERLGFSCSFQITSLIPEQPQLERRRGTQACIECRSQKSKCSGEQPTCAGCRRRGRECVYPDSRRKPSRTGQPSRSHPTSNSMQDISAGQIDISESQNEPGGTRQDHEGFEAAPPSSRQSPPSADCPTADSDTETPTHQLPSVNDQAQLIAGFFRHIYPIPLYSFLNEESITQRCLEENLPLALNLAICAVSALHLQDHRYHPAATISWIRRAESILWSRIEHPTIFRTQAILLVIQYRIETGEFQKAFMLSSIASRAASALRLHYERTDIHPLAQEVRRRLMWCLLLMDMRFSNGLPECELCPFENVYLNRPCSEEEFNALNETGRDRNEIASHDDIAEDGLFSLLIRQATLRRDISRLKRQVSLAVSPVPQLEGLVNAFKGNLDQLPMAPYRLEDLQTYAKSRWLLRYVLAHLSWRQCHCDLYRLFLSGYKEAAPDIITGSVSPAFTQNAASLCLHHAQSIITILHDLAGLDTDMKVVDNDIAICSYHASRIIIFISRSHLKPSDSDLTTEAAVAQARSTLVFLRRLYKSSRLAQYILSDLEAVIRDPTTTAVAKTDEEAPEDGQPPAPKRPRFARTAQKHQNLAVHSVLRHALFVDDSHRAAGQSKKQAKKPDDSPGPNATSKDFPRGEDRPHSVTSMIHNRYDAFDGLALETDVLSDTAGGDFMGLPAQSFNELSGFSFWGNWNETWGPNEWPMGSDENYF